MTDPNLYDRMWRTRVSPPLTLQMRGPWPSFRHELSQWLRAHFALDPVRRNDVLLAVNEALTNAAEFAYRGAARHA